MGEKDESTELKEWRTHVRRVLSRLPNDYASAGGIAADIRKIFQEELASAIEPRFNEHLQTMKQDTYAEKKALASWVNNELHYVQGLAIRCPRSGRAAILITDIRDSKAGSSRFRLEGVGEDGHKVRTYSSGKLPELQLMGDPPRRESLSRWGKPDSKER